MERIFIRQTVLITLLAHIGSFVPAQKTVLGPIDAIFTALARPVMILAAGGQRLWWK
ncbi:MAG: hypothetical protein R3E08_05290 [Thiotrichaceae bacterium]